MPISSTPGLRILYRSQSRTGTLIVLNPNTVDNTRACQSVPEIETFQEGRRLYPNTTNE